MIGDEVHRVWDGRDTVCTVHHTLDGVVIRVATTADIDGVVACGTGLFLEDGAARDRLRNVDWPRLNAETYERANLADPDVLVLVAERGSEIIGHLTGFFHSASAMWTAPIVDLVSVYLTVPWRGQGIGLALIMQFKLWAEQREAAQIRVTASAANLAAIGFYERIGFKPLETTLSWDL